MERDGFCSHSFRAFRFVRTRVVTIRRQVNVGRCLSIDLLRKLKELSWRCYRNTGPIPYVKDIRAAKSCRSMSFVIMSHSTAWPSYGVNPVGSYPAPVSGSSRQRIITKALSGGLR